MMPWPYPRWIAHRGAGKLAPENTLAAFKLGAAFGTSPGLWAGMQLQYDLYQAGKMKRPKIEKLVA